MTNCAAPRALWTTNYFPSLAYLDRWHNTTAAVVATAINVHMYIYIYNYIYIYV